MFLDPLSIERTNLSTRVIAGRAFLIKTRPSVDYLKKMKVWLTTGSQGALVYGQPRLGKTSATRWMLKMLPELIGKFPAVEVPVRAHKLATEREFFQHLLRCVRHKHAMFGSSGDKRDRFAEWLIPRAMRSPINAAVLFFDEAQLLQNQQYDWLLNIGNELDRNGCRLFCLFVGQPELAYVKPRFIGEGKEQIVGRFMVRELEFSGISTQEDLIASLDEFHNTIYPLKTEKLFAEAFIPAAIAGGFTLSSLGPGLWSAFRERWLSEGFGDEVTIPMQYLTASLTEILNSLVRYDKENLTVPHDLINKSVSDSGYIDSLRAQKSVIRKVLNKKH